MLKFASGHRALDLTTERFYRDVLQRLSDAGVDFLVGGAYAFAGYTGIIRHTKDLDLFLRPLDCERALKILEDAGYRTEVTDRIWLAKAYSDSGFVDFIFRSGNGVSEVDDGWFAHAKEALVLDIPVRLCSPEETIWSKAFVMERERYDGADVAHYLLVHSSQMDWRRLVDWFGKEWRVLLSHLILFGFIYPHERTRLPPAIMQELLGRLAGELDRNESQNLCQGTLLSRVHFIVDTQRWGFVDARFRRRGTITRGDINHWRHQTRAESEELLERSGIFLDEVDDHPPH